MCILPMWYLFMNLVHVISHFVFCTDFLGSWLVVLCAASWEKWFESQRSPRKFCLAGPAQTGIVVCKLQPSDIYHHLIFGLFLLHSSHWGKKKPTSTIWSRLTFVSAALLNVFHHCQELLSKAVHWKSLGSWFYVTIVGEPWCINQQWFFTLTAHR